MAQKATDLPVDPERALDQGLSAVKEQSYYMRSALDAGNLREALKFGSGMLNELRTSALSPRLYYQLYVSVFDELRTLEQYFSEECKAGRKMAIVYEKVQHAGNIVPRLYLLITVGAAYIESHEAPAHQILKDLLEMVKGVQHPIRGLFLRYYLLKSMKEKLPDKGTPYIGEGGDVDDAVSFIISNLAEMNRLWVRLSFVGGSRQKQKRDLERKELRVTVGQNIIRLSNLEGLTLKLYETSVQPKLCEIIGQSKDALAQQYLLDCMIQAFPDEFHLQTLDSLLDLTTMMLPQVDVLSIYINLVERLSLFASNSEENVEELMESKNVFGLIKKYIDRKVKTSQETEGGGPPPPLKKELELLVAFLRFSIKSYPLRTDYVNHILQSAVDAVRTRSAAELESQECLKLIQRLLIIPLDTLSLSILSMNQYPQLMQYLNFPMRRSVANSIVRAVIKSQKLLESEEVVSQLLQFIKPLLKDQEDYEKCEDFEFDEEQEAVARLAHIINLKDLNSGWTIIKQFDKAFLDGGNQRMKHTIPSLIFTYFRLARVLDQALQHNLTLPDVAPPPPEQQPHEQGVQLQEPTQVQEGDDVQEHAPPAAPAAEVAQPEELKEAPPSQIAIPHNLTILNIYQTISQILAVISPQYPEICLRLYLQSLESLSTIHTKEGEEMEHLAYDLASQCFTLYQDELSDSESKFQAINLILATFSSLTCLSADDYDTLAKNATQYAAKQLKKPQQSEAVLQATHLFWNVFNRQQNLVTQCLTRAQNIANICMANPRNIHLLVKLLDKYLYFYSMELPGLAAQNVNAIIGVLNKHFSKIQEDMGNADTSLKEAYRVAHSHYQLTLKSIQVKAATDPRFTAVHSSD